MRSGASSAEASYRDTSTPVPAGLLTSCAMRSNSASSSGLNLGSYVFGILGCSVLEASMGTSARICAIIASRS